MDYEYGVMATYLPGLHRGPMSKEEAELWVADWVALYPFTLFVHNDIVTQGRFQCVFLR